MKKIGLYVLLSIWLTGLIASVVFMIVLTLKKFFISALSLILVFSFFLPLFIGNLEAIKKLPKKKRKGKKKKNGKSHAKKIHSKQVPHIAKPAPEIKKPDVEILQEIEDETLTEEELDAELQKTEKSSSDLIREDFIGKAEWVKNLKQFEDCQTLIFDKLSCEFLFVSVSGRWAFYTRAMSEIRIRPNKEINSISIEEGNKIVVHLDFSDQLCVTYQKFKTQGKDSETRKELRRDAREIVSELRSLKEAFTPGARGKTKIEVPHAILKKVNARSRDAIKESEQKKIKDSKSFVVRSSHEKKLHYEVTVRLYEDGRLHFFCSCPAGLKGSHCKHRINIIRGRRVGIQHPESPRPDLKIIQSWLKDSPLKELADTFVAFSDEEIEKERELILIKKKFKLVKEKLSAAFFGAELKQEVLEDLGEYDKDYEVKSPPPKGAQAE